MNESGRKSVIWVLFNLPTNLCIDHVFVFVCEGIKYDSLSLRHLQTQT